MWLLPYQRFTVETRADPLSLVEALQQGTRARHERGWFANPRRPLRRIRLDASGFRLGMRIWSWSTPELVAAGRFRPCGDVTIVSVAIRPPWIFFGFLALWSGPVILATVLGLRRGLAGLLPGVGMLFAFWAMIMSTFAWAAKNIRAEVERILYAA